MSPNNKPRLHYIDFMKGLCILLIIINHENEHIFSLLGDNVNYVLESFRIPMYYFISGIFFKHYDGFSDFARRKINNIVVPLCFFYLLSCLVVAMIHLVPSLQRSYPVWEWSMLADPVTQRLWRANVPMWFLLSLFEVNLMCYMLHTVVHRPFWRITATMILSLVGYYLSSQHIHPPLLLDTALLGMPYFMLGTAAKQQGMLTPSRHDRWGWLSLVLTLLAIYPLAQELNLWKQVLPHYIYLYLVPACAILSLTWACKRLGYVTIIGYIGRYSLVVLCTHILLMPLVERVLWHFLPHTVCVSLAVVAIIVLIEFPLIKLFTTIMPHFTAQKPLFEKGWRLNNIFLPSRSTILRKK